MALDKSDNFDHWDVASPLVGDDSEDGRMALSTSMKQTESSYISMRRKTSFRFQLRWGD
jgi:hypothetical protein